MQSPSGYGVGLGPYNFIQPDIVTVSLGNSGLVLDRATHQLQDGESPDASDVRFESGGVSTDYDISALGTAYAGTDDKTIVGILPFQLDDLTTFLIRARPTGWDRWNGSTWLTLTGALTGTAADRVRAVSFNNQFIVANGVDRLKVWDGNDATVIADLAADAPIAKYITRIGNRIMCAAVHISGVLDPHAVQWSADGDATVWSDPLQGSGLAELWPEGTNRSANIITGLSTLAGGAVIYRQKSIQIGTLTGVGAAPFRFDTIDFNHGTQSPDSVAYGGPTVGDFFLGDDMVVYLFDGTGSPTPIGLPISQGIEDTIADPTKAVGVVYGMEYILGFPTQDGGLIDTVYAFNIRTWVRDGRLVWRKRSMGHKYKTMSIGPVPTRVDPTINSDSRIVNTVQDRPNDYANTNAPERVLFGDEVGQVYYLDTSRYISTGVYYTRQFGDPSAENTIDRVRIAYKGQSGALVEVSVSVDDGPFQTPRLYYLEDSGTRYKWASEDFRVTGRFFQLRIALLAGPAHVSEVQIVVQPRGRGVS